jgi:hypothetical protein
MPVARYKPAHRQALQHYENQDYLVLNYEVPEVSHVAALGINCALRR